MYLIILGPHGAGKGTQAKLISEKYGVERISTGDIFREHMKNDTEFGKKVKGYMDANVYVPDKLTNVLLGVNLRKYKSNGFILDGYPRTLTQAEFLDRLLAELKIKLDAVINLLVDKEELIKRMMKRAKEEKRSDDTEEGIRSRMREYETKAEPVIDYYRKKGKVTDINGDQPVEKVLKDIRQVLDKLIG
ncbi:MAG: adenylate kinase [Candidatus Aenigmarchaeota archaeon]|nr:adenylate kinase [Candidatus Aenigmarchaeota archaeon]